MMRKHVSETPPTPQDQAILSGIAARQSGSVLHWKNWLDTMRASDRRDAEVMLDMVQRWDAYRFVCAQPIYDYDAPKS
jgi:hypothetical protein